jgi:hypothetical protein
MFGSVGIGRADAGLDVEGVAPAPVWEALELADEAVCEPVTEGLGD